MSNTTTTFDWLSEMGPALAAQEAWFDGSYQEESLFHLLYQPQISPFAIACGAGLLAEHVRRFRFTPVVMQRLGQMRDEKGRALFQESFLNHIQRMKLRVNVYAPPEGMLLLPGEPLLIAQGPYAQVMLMESAFRWLVWRSTQWATRVAGERWRRQDWQEEDSPVAPQTGFYPDGWKIRAEFIGGAFAEYILDTIRLPSRLPSEKEGLHCVWQASSGPVAGQIPLVQVRRLYKGQQALGDLWLTEAQEEEASVSKNSARMLDNGTIKTLKFSRFQNLYQPLLAKGHPVLAPQRAGYLRQRMLKQLEAFHAARLDEYPRGWYV